jgi:exosortase/archaeosortase family protein
MFSAKKFVKRNERKIRMLARFLVVFNLLAIPMYAVMLSGTQLPALQDATTTVVFAVFRLLGYDATRSGTTIGLGAPLNVNIAIDTDCAAWKSMYAYAALVLATPFAMGWKKRSGLVLAGTVALFALNVVRIVSTVAAAMAFGLAVLDVVHTVFWREGMILAVVLLWFLAVRGYRARPKGKK